MQDIRPLAVVRTDCFLNMCQTYRQELPAFNYSDITCALGAGQSLYCANVCCGWLPLHYTGNSLTNSYVPSN